jgi:hypothetical protein
MDIVTERFRLLRTHAWSDEVLHDLLERSRRGRRQA